MQQCFYENTSIQHSTVVPTSESWNPLDFVAVIRFLQCIATLLLFLLWMHVHTKYSVFTFSCYWLLLFLLYQSLSFFVSFSLGFLKSHLPLLPRENNVSTSAAHFAWLDWAPTLSFQTLLQILALFWSIRCVCLQSSKRYTYTHSIHSLSSRLLSYLQKNYECCTYKQAKGQRLQPT